MLPVSGRERLFGVIEKLRARGGRVIFDNNYRPRLWRGDPNTAEWFDRAFANADLAMITLEDNAALYGHDEESALSHAFSLTAEKSSSSAAPIKTIVRVRGMEAFMGADLQGCQGGRHDRAPATPLPVAILLRVCRDSRPKFAARSGNKIASIVVQYPGAIIPREAMPVFFFT